MYPSTARVGCESSCGAASRLPVIQGGEPRATYLRRRVSRPSELPVSRSKPAPRRIEFAVCPRPPVVSDACSGPLHSKGSRSRRRRPLVPSSRSGVRKFRVRMDDLAQVQGSESRRPLRTQLGRMAVAQPQGTERTRSRYRPQRLGTTASKHARSSLQSRPLSRAGRPPRVTGARQAGWQAMRRRPHRR